MVGGDQSVYTSYKPVLNLIGEKVMYCGEQGMGAVCKIVNNLINLGNYVLVSEALTLGLKAGAQTDIMFEAISHSSGNTECMQEFPGSLFQRNFEPGISVGSRCERCRSGNRTGASITPTDGTRQHHRAAFHRSAKPRDGDNLHQSPWRDFRKSEQMSKFVYNRRDNKPYGASW